MARKGAYSEHRKPLRAPQRSAQPRRLARVSGPIVHRPTDARSFTGPIAIPASSSSHSPVLLRQSERARLLLELEGPRCLFSSFWLLLFHIGFSAHRNGLLQLLEESRA